MGVASNRSKARCRSSARKPGSRSMSFFRASPENPVTVGLVMLATTEILST
jgi:hypothetical protein